MSAIAAFIFDSFLGRLAALALLATSLFTWFAFEQQAKGARDVTSKLNRSAAVLAQEGVAARMPAERPGAVERLLKHSCGDC